MKKGFLSIIFFAVLIYSCSKSSSGTQATDCSNSSYSFSSNVSPLFQTYCATSSGCHASGSQNGPGPLVTYAQIYAARLSIRDAVASGLMPKGTTLSSAERSVIICWIDNGAVNN